MSKKNKEMAVDFRKTTVNHEPLYIANELVENVTEYEYLGTTIDSTFTYYYCKHNNVALLVYYRRSWKTSRGLNIFASNHYCTNLPKF